MIDKVKEKKNKRAIVQKWHALGIVKFYVSVYKQKIASVKDCMVYNIVSLFIKQKQSGNIFAAHLL